MNGDKTDSQLVAAKELPVALLLAPVTTGAVLNYHRLNGIRKSANRGSVYEVGARLYVLIDLIRNVATASRT